MKDYELDKLQPIKPEDPAGLISCFKQLEAVHALFQQAQDNLSQHLGVPLCVQCAMCCKRTTVTGMILEAEHAVSWLIGTGPEKQAAILDICESWLLEKHQTIRVYEGTRNPRQLEHRSARILEEAKRLTLKFPCPFLSAENNCLIHPVRPIVCRAYGITRLPAYSCSRPLGVGEVPTFRAHIGGEPAALIRSAYEALQVLAGDEQVRKGFMATWIFATLRPQKFAAYIYDNRIATAKISQFKEDGNVLWQEHLSRVWEMENLCKVN